MKPKLYTILPLTLLPLYLSVTPPRTLPHFLQTSTAENSWAQKTLKSLSLRQKLGQLFSFVPGTEDIVVDGTVMPTPKSTPAEIEQLIKKYHVGGVLFIRRTTIAEHINLVNTWQQMSDIPLLVIEDLEWGLTMRLDDAINFPRNMTLGAIQDTNLIYELGQKIGRECALIGVGMNLAPVVDVNCNPQNPVINYRSFGEDPEMVAEYGALFMQGLQDTGILACAKHFPGHGDTEIDSHLTLPLVPHPLERLEKVELIPFKELINRGVDAVMCGHLMIPALDKLNISTFSPAIMDTLLQKKLGFKGLIATDALCMGALGAPAPGDAELRAFLAGSDLLICSMNIPLAIERLASAVESGIITHQEVDKRVLKILRAKEYLGLHLRRLVDPANLANINTPAALNLKKKLYQNAITLVKNKNNIVPILPASSNLTVIQIGGKRDNPFVQKLATTHTCSIFTAPATQTVGDAELLTEQVIAATPTGSAIIICLCGMHRLARTNFGITDGTRALIGRLTGRTIPVVLVICGSPYSLAFFGEQDAIIVAYEEDSDALRAAADVITGQIAARGKLPVTEKIAFP